MTEANHQLTKEQKEHISQAVNRLFRIKRKIAIRKAGQAIIYPISFVQKLTTKDN